MGFFDRENSNSSNKLHNNEWRDFKSACEWDLQLVEAIFHRLAKETYPNQMLKNEDDPQYFKTLLFTKSEILIALELQDQLLQKRARIRMLHTDISASAKDIETISLDNFFNYRVKQRTLCFYDIQRMLKKIYETIEETHNFNLKLEEFQKEALKTSSWCVRNIRHAQPKPSKYYKIHEIPPKKKSLYSIQLEKKLVQKHALALTNVAIDCAIRKQVEIRREEERKQREQYELERQMLLTSSSSSNNLVGSRMKRRSPTNSFYANKRAEAIRSRAQMRQEKAMREASLQSLRLQMMSPNLQESYSKTVFGTQTSASMGICTPQEANEQFLALVEASGDVTLAKKLLTQKPLLAGIRRTIDQATRLNIPMEDQWGVLQIWRSTYRNHTFQAMQYAKLR